MFKGKKLKKSEKPKTFIPGEQVDKSAFNYQNSQGFSQDHFQQRAERVQPSKEDIEAIRVSGLQSNFTFCS